MRKRIFQVGGAVLSAVYNVVSLVMDAKNITSSISWQYHAIGGFVLFVGFVVWIIWDKQSEIDTLKRSVRMVARMDRLGSYHIGNDYGVEFLINLEVWVDWDVHTENLILNLVGNRALPFIAIPMWKIWELWIVFIKTAPHFRRLVGLRPVQGQYRKHIKCTDNQPFSDSIIFRLKDKDKDRVLSFSRVFMFEVVLLTGVPKAEYRQYLQWKALAGETLKPA